jgi:uncharacterized protein (TIGR03032 family)
LRDPYRGDPEVTETTTPPQKPAEPQLQISTSRQFMNWLADSKVSLAFTTYQAGKVFLVGAQADGKLSVFERTLPRCMGLAVHGNSLYVTSLYQLWRFENTLAPGETHGDYDRVYLPQVGWVTGDLDVHDVALDADGRIVFVNTLFGCLATVSDTHSFVPLWRPPFVSRLAAEDRCHLNGLAMKEGRAAYTTAVAETDVVDAWREHRRDGGIVVDVENDAVALRGLSMPHSPRWYRDKLWLHNSGTGHFGYADLAAGTFQQVAFCPGYLRGLAFHGDFALVGVSNSRENRTFSGLALEENLAQHKVEPRCALYVIDLRTGDAVHWLRIEGVVRELYDVAVLPGVRQPMMIGFLSDEIRRVIRVGAGPGA